MLQHIGWSGLKWQTYVIKQIQVRVENEISHKIGRREGLEDRSQIFLTFFESPVTEQGAKIFQDK